MVSNLGEKIELILARSKESPHIAKARLIGLIREGGQETAKQIFDEVDELILGTIENYENHINTKDEFNFVEGLKAVYKEFEKLKAKYLKQLKEVNENG